MRRLFGSLVMVAATLVPLAGAEFQQYSEPEIQAMVATVKGGLLVKNDEPTTCELIVLDDRTSVVAASCLNFNSDGAVDYDTNYQVYLDDGGDSSARKYGVADIIVNPKFNATTHVNDIAVLMYNSDGGFSGQQGVVPVQVYRTDPVLVRRRLLDKSTMKWDTPKVVSKMFAGDAVCKDLSPMYDTNSMDLVSNDGTTVFDGSPATCDTVPDGVAYIAYQDTFYPIGPYSFTAIGGGDSLCNYKQQCSYFTKLAMYFSFISQATGRNIYYNSTVYDTDQEEGSGDGSSRWTAGYSMIDKDFGGDATIVGGDFYARNTPDEDKDESTADDESTAQDKPDEGGGGLSQQSKIIIGVCVAVGSVVLICTASFFARWFYLRSHRTDIVDPMGQTAYQDALEADLGGAYTAHHVPQPYPSNDDDLPPPCYDDPPTNSSVIGTPPPDGSDHQSMAAVMHSVDTKIDRAESKS
ncbi:hypothetical protein GGF46_003753 [Coemansia sp. RSA 552]|nr:hypothetical protein GGF46_003753 [Coemansia sp. RSA 552]